MHALIAGNNFLYQEPGTSEDISTFIASKEVTFPAMEKVDCGISVTAHPLFPFLCNALPDTGAMSFLLGHGVKW
jgi:glutathione peroxidase-family protein